MNRQQKELVVDLFNKDFSTSKGSFFVEYSGLTVAQMQRLRKQLREKGGSLKIAKMRLVKRALNGIAGSDELFSH
jgi:large subunit ribosomal protein L10